MDARLLAFAGLAALITVLPGPDMALVMRNVFAHGRAAILPTALGINCGLLVWAAGSSLGVAALLAASAQLYDLLRLGGAIYLFYLGVSALLGAWRRRDAVAEAPSDRPALGRGSAFRQGLLSNLLNPKIGVLYATLLPQFIAPGQPVFARSMLLASIHVSFGIPWLIFYGYMVSRLGDVLRGGRVRRTIEGVTGTVLVAFGLRLAVDRG